MRVPALILKQLYTFGSLENVPGAVRFALKNRLSDATLTRLVGIRVNDEEVPLADLSLDLGDGRLIPGGEVTPQETVAFPLKKTVHITARIGALAIGKHEVTIAFEAEPFGSLLFTVKDAIAEVKHTRVSVPADKDDNQS